VKETGGNLIYGETMSRSDLLSAIMDGLVALESYASATGRSVDYGAIEVETRRTRSGAISVRVLGDLADPS